jgi:hypothetical protein
MNTNVEQAQAEWHTQLARIATQVESLKAKADTEFRALYTTLSAEIAALQADLKKLKAEVDATGPDAYAKMIEKQIEDLQAKGNAAYEMLRSRLVTQPDPADTEIKQLEAAAATASGSARTSILSRIDQLKVAKADGARTT